MKETALATPPPTEGFGTPIDRQTAQGYIDNFIRVDTALKDQVLPQVTSTIKVGPLTPVQPGEINNLFGSGYNGFMFSRDSLNRFFNEGAEFLLVLLGAKQVTGYPTIVLVGCNPDGEGGYVSLKDPLPATEQPPRMVVPEIPMEGDRLSFKFKL